MVSHGLEEGKIGDLDIMPLNGQGSQAPYYRNSHSPIYWGFHHRLPSLPTQLHILEYLWVVISGVNDWESSHFSAVIFNVRVSSVPKPESTALISNDQYILLLITLRTTYWQDMFQMWSPHPTCIFSCRYHCPLLLPRNTGTFLSMWNEIAWRWFLQRLSIIFHTPWCARRAPVCYEGSCKSHSILENQGINSHRQ